jgi:hypothetical protein
MLQMLQHDLHGYVRCSEHNIVFDDLQTVDLLCDVIIEEKGAKGGEKTAGTIDSGGAVGVRGEGF